jgi:carboxypeptidase Q
MGVKTVSNWEIGGGDENAFRNANLPSYSFIQDPIDYEPRTHHSSADHYERLIEEDLLFNTAFIAYTAWKAAQDDEKFPRK